MLGIVALCLASLSIILERAAANPMPGYDIRAFNAVNSNTSVIDPILTPTLTLVLLCNEVYQKLTEY